MGLNQACYLASTDKIYGVIENYIVKFNALTGAKEAYAKVAAPLYGPCTCVAGVGVIYVGAWADFSYNDTDHWNISYQNKGVFNVDPATLAVTNYFELDKRYQVFEGAVYRNYFGWGAGEMLIKDGYLYWDETFPGLHQVMRVAIADPTDSTINDNFKRGWTGFRPEGWCCGTRLGTDYMWSLDGNQQQVEIFTITPPPGPFDTPFDPYVSSPDLAPYDPAAVIYVPSADKVYAVAGTDVMLRVDALGGGLTALNLGAVWADVKPYRIRISPLNGKLYIPCQHQNVVIVWDTATETGVAKSTLIESPVDVVFTGTKAFAVQSGPVPLREIV